MSTWTNWAGLATAHPTAESRPHDADEVVAAVRDARERGLRVKMHGTGHSFTDIAVTDGVMLHPDSLRGITAVDRGAGTVTVLAGTPLHVVNEALVRLGLSLHNMGDVQEQTVAGAVSTGTHGTGGKKASLSHQVRALELVDGTGRLRTLSAESDPALLEVARIGLGALGVLTSVTLEVEELYTLDAHEWPVRWEEAVEGFEELATAHDHFEVYWWPHTDRCLAKADDRTTEDPAPLSRAREWWDDRFLSNTVFGAAQRLGNLRPGLVRPLNRLSARALGERRYRDVPHRVFTSPRSVRFREMEYAVPREAGMTALAEVRRVLDRSDLRVGFPVEVRHAPGDDVPLSAAYGRDTVYLAFHVNAATDHTAYFRAVEEVALAHDGRPHWGKLHTRTADDLAPAYPRWDDVLAAREALDPDRVFGNAYLTRVLGP